MRVVTSSLAVALGVIATGCAGAYENETPLPLATSIHYTQQVSYSTNITTPAPTPASLPASAPATVSVSPSDWHRVVILQSSHLDRPSEVLGIVDVHEEMGKHEQALDEMKQQAARLGADAVVGVEFHHGEGHGEEPTHLSGLAVRYLPRPL